MTPRNHKPLLVVDDEPNNRDMLARRLKKAGYEVECAQNASEALDILNAREIELVLLDNMMPGMSGIDLLRLVRATRSERELPIIMVTALSESDSVVEALNSGANDYITKPVDYPVALARIGSQITRKAAEEALRVSEERYSLAARGANDGLWDWDLTTGSVHYSGRWKEMLGIPAGTDFIDSLAWLQLVHPEDRERVEAEWADVRRSAGPTRLISHQRLRHADGTYRWCLVRGHVQRAPSGETLRIAGSVTDVTQNMAFDSLTGLPNRNLLVEVINRNLNEAAEAGQPPRLALMFLDLDRFKVINDSLGHLAGDELLVCFARRLEAILRSCEVAQRESAVVRLGGDEFGVLISPVNSPEEAGSVAQMILKAALEPFQLAAGQTFTSVSIGIALADETHLSAPDLLRDADAAMYRAKSLGRARCEFFTAEIRSAAIRRQQLEADLRRALDHGELEVFYQSKVSLTTKQVVGFEALVRWNHPTRGLINPVDFIPLAEETGLIVPLGLWVLQQAVRQLAEWQGRHPTHPPLEVGVNLSPRQFHDERLIPEIQAALANAGVPPSALQIEVTEGVFIEDPQHAIETLTRLKALGVGVKLDDFGSGYSSLSYLCNLPCDALKIDRSFVSNMMSGKKEMEVVKAILALAGSLGKEVTAEGIETGEQEGILTSLGCDFGQGYYYSKPVPADEAEKAMLTPPYCSD